MRCVITGCCLHHMNTNRFAHGDLFEIGDTYVFMANVYGSHHVRPRETAWEDKPTSPRVIGLVMSNFFDRRGIVVVSKDRCVLNDAAKHRAFGDKNVVKIDDEEQWRQVPRVNS